MMLCDARGKFLYEARPDLFPQGFLTTTEIELWGKHYKAKRRQNGR